MKTHNKILIKSYLLATLIVLDIAYLIHLLTN